MSDRLCGYCRNAGHNKNACPILLGQRKAILNHAAIERKAIVELCLANGIGCGTIFKQRLYDDTERMMVVTSMQQLVNDAWDKVIDYRNVKYSRRVISYLRTWSGNLHCETSDVIRQVNLDRIYVPCRSLNDMSYNSYVYISIHKLAVRPEWSLNHKPTAWEIMTEQTSSADIVSASDICDLSDVDYLTPVRFHERLSLKSDATDKHTPYFPT